MIPQAPYHMTLLRLRYGAKRLRNCRRIAVLTRKIRGK